MLAGTGAGGKKRIKAEDDVDPPKGNISPGDLADSLRQAREFMQATTAEAVQSTVAKIASQFETLVTGLDEKYAKRQKYTKRLDSVAMEVNETKQKISKLEAMVEAQNQIMETLAEQIGVAELPTPVKRDGDNFEQPPDPCIIHIGAEEVISSNAALAAIQGWLQEAAISKDQLKILSGPEAIGRNFAVRVNSGSNDLSALKIKVAFEKLKLPSGAFREFYAISPLGAQVQLYVNRDKSLRQFKTEAEEPECPKNASSPLGAQVALYVKKDKSLRQSKTEAEPPKRQSKTRTEPPKRPMSAYLIWRCANWGRLAKSGGSMSMINKKAGKEWRTMGSKIKAKYQRQAVKAKATWEKEKEAFEAFKAAGGVVDPPLIGRKHKKAQAPRDSNKPRRPHFCGYGVWFQENRQKIKDSLPRNHKWEHVCKAAGKMWRSMTAEAKAPFEAKYKQQMSKYYRKQMEQ